MLGLVRRASRIILTPAGAVAVAVLGSIPVKELREPLVDPDLWWHLRTGELIASTRGIPRADTYSFTAFGEPWVVQEWGAELLLHWIREQFGLWGIIAYRAVVLTAIYVLVARLFVRIAGGGLGTWALIGLTAYAGAPNWTERPNLLSFLLFVVTLIWIERRDGRIWWFVPMAAVWANLHGMVILGVGLVALVAVAEWIKVWFGLGGADRVSARRFALVAGFGLVATLLNPAGPGLLSHALTLVREVRGIVTEWASPDFHQLGPLLFLALMLLTILSFAYRRVRPDLTDVVLALAFSFLALQAVRNLLVSAIVLGLVLARGATDALPRGAMSTTPRADENRLIPATAIAVVLATFVYLVAAGAPRGERVIGDDYPVAAIDALGSPGVKVFVYDVWSGMVIDRAWPDARVYADLRTDFYGRAHMRRYQRTIAARPDWRRNLDEACVTHVLIQPADSLAQVLEQDLAWRTARRDDKSVTFERTRTPADC